MSAKERLVALALLAAIAGCALFIAAYAASGSRLYEGLSIALAAAAFSAAALGWAFWVVPQETVADEVDTYPSSERDRASQSGELASDARAISRSRILVGLLVAAAGALIAALAVPLRSLGPATDDALFHTRWRRGDRLVREDGRAVRLDDLNVDSAVTVFPESAPGDSQSQTTLIRLPQDSPNSIEGYVAYSRICTHAGCPVALYRAEAKQLFCPCHQSTFDVTQNGAVVSGPADHALPRLPLQADADGTLRAAGDFPVPVGPGFWERG